MLFLALIYLAYISLGLPDAVLGASWPIMHVALAVPVSSAGFVSVITTGGTIVSSLFSHRVIRRFGTGKVTLVSVTLTAFALLGIALSPSLYWLMLFAIPMGLGAGAVDSGLNAYVAVNYKARHMNWLHCFWGVGAMTGPLLVSQFSGSGRGWQSTYFTISILQFCLVGLLFFSLPEWKKRQSVQPLDARGHQVLQEHEGIRALIKGKKARLAMATFFIYTAIEASMMLWGASYLVAAKEVNPQTAAGWVSLFFLGITAGRFLSGFISIKLNNQTIIRYGCLLVLLGFALLAISFAPWLTITAFVLIGLGLAPIFPSMMHETPGNFGLRHAQAAMGMQMAFAYVGSSLMPPLLGYLYTSTSFIWMPFVLLLMSLALYGCTRYLTILRKAEPVEP